ARMLWLEVMVRGFAGFRGRVAGWSALEGSFKTFRAFMPGTWQRFSIGQDTRSGSREMSLSMEMLHLSSVHSWTTGTKSSGLERPKDDMACTWVFSERPRRTCL